MGKRLPLLLLFLLLLPGCAAPGGKPLGRDFRLDYIAKSDVDMVSEVNQKAVLDSLRLLTEKLYKRNPKEWHKSGQANAEAAAARLFDGVSRKYLVLGGRRGSDAIYLAFDDSYSGDRVLAFCFGLKEMLLASYGNKTEFFLTDDLDPQKLYNSARNLEIAAWKLANTRNARGELFLLSNEAEGPVKNLSFEREFGKMIAGQDTLAKIIAEKTNRSIAHVAQSVATAVFLPIPIPK